MDIVLLRCTQCNAKIGSLTNIWTQIGDRYVTQAIRSEDSTSKTLKVKPSGAVRVGDVDTLISGCVLKEAECEQCHTSVGQICIKTPPNHVLHDGQVMFRTTSITVRSGYDHRRLAKLKIQNALKLRDPPTQPPSPAREDPRPGPDAPDLLQMQNDLEAQKREIQRIGSTGFQVMSTFETTVARFESQMKRINESLDAVRDDEESCRKDLSSLKAKVTELQWQPLPDQTSTSTSTSTSTGTSTSIGNSNSNSDSSASLRDELAQTQHQLAQLRAENASLKTDVQDAQDVARECISTSKLYAAEISGLRGEIQQLKLDLASGNIHIQSPPASNEDSLVASYTHELDILATNVSKIGHRTSQIDSLQMEFQLFRARVQRLEARSASCTPHPLPLSRGEGAAAQKRPSMSGEDALGYEATPSKRVAVAVASSHTVGLSFDDRSVGEELPSSPPVVRARSPQVVGRTTSADGARKRFLGKMRR